MEEYLVEEDGAALRLVAVAKAGFQDWLKSQPASWGPWVKAAGFAGETGATCLVADDQGQPECVLVGLGDGDDPWVWAGLPSRLGTGVYRLDKELGAKTATWAATAWMLGSYGFDRYKSKSNRKLASLVWPAQAERDEALYTAQAVSLVRDLINTPAADLGPKELAESCAEVAAKFGAAFATIDGKDLVARNYPAIFAVGKGAGAGREPRLIDITWGDPAHPKVTLVGKGVCFDSGGLDLKPSSNMKLMKKDMGGAAHALGLASMIMAAALPVRLRVLIPAVENSVSGESMRPLDVLATRKGLSVEVGNTDAEGRLILSDALWEASGETPDVLIDFATLTGAARTALGPDLPALFANDDVLANDLLDAGLAVNDPMWRLPLHAPYRRMIDSKVADLTNAPDSPFAGAITAALFLKEFVGAGIPWAHFDIMAWNGASRPGRPEGGEAMAMRAVFAALRKRYQKSHL